MRVQIREVEEEERYSIIMKVNRSVPYHYNSKSISMAIRKLEVLCGYVDEGVKWFCTNYGRSIKVGAKGFTYKRDNQYWTGNDCNISWRKVHRIVDWLEENEYIDMYSGFNDSWRFGEQGDNCPSIIIFKDKLFSLYENHKFRGFNVTNLESEIVVKKRNTEDVYLEENCVVGAKPMKKGMKVYNKHLSESNVKYDGDTIPAVEYFRSFIDNEKKGGRLYVAGGGVQLLPQEVRHSKLTIDDEPVIELDYSSMHPNMLYEEAQVINEKSGGDSYFHLQLGKNFKPYGADLSELNVNYGKVEYFRKKYGKPNYDPVRNFAKMVLLFSINTDSIQSACGALIAEFKKDRTKTGADEKKQKYYGIEFPLKTKYACEQMQMHNAIIEDHFFQDVGIYLQRKDSDIISLVVEEMLLQDETILCYHDSAICRQGAEAKLEQAMRSAWKEVLGDNKFCYIDKK